MPIIMFACSYRLLNFEDFHAQMSTGVMIEFFVVDLLTIVASLTNSFITERVSHFIIYCAIVHILSWSLFIIYTLALQTSDKRECHLCPVNTNLSE